MLRLSTAPLRVRLLGRPWQSVDGDGACLTRLIRTNHTRPLPEVEIVAALAGSVEGAGQLLSLNGPLSAIVLRDAPSNPKGWDPQEYADKITEGATGALLEATGGRTAGAVTAGSYTTREERGAASENNSLRTRTSLGAFLAPRLSPHSPLSAPLGDIEGRAAR